MPGGSERDPSCDSALYQRCYELNGSDPNRHELSCGWRRCSLHRFDPVTTEHLTLERELPA